MKKVLVTGAGGYIGRHVVAALLNSGAHVVATDLSVEGIDERAERIQADLFGGAEGMFDKFGSPDACVHMAWKDGFNHNSDLHMLSLSDHYRFVSQMLEDGLKQMTIMGTMHEIGYWEGAVDENTPCNPLSLYGIAKDSLRRSTFLLAKRNNAIAQWLRVFYIYGDDKRSNSIFGKIVRAEEEGKASFPFTSGKNKYDFISIDELANQISACAMQENVTGIINCCTGIPRSLAEQVERFISENNFKIKLDYGAFPDRIYDSPGEWGDPAKIELIMKERA